MTIVEACESKTNTTFKQTNRMSLSLSSHTSIECCSCVKEILLCPIDNRAYE